MLLELTIKTFTVIGDQTPAVLPHHWFLNHDSVKLSSYCILFYSHTTVNCSIARSFIWAGMANSILDSKYVLVLFIIYQGSTNNGQVYQISSVESLYPCQVQPCLTLSQFASDVSRYFLSNATLTLILQPGQHVLDVTLRVENELSLNLSSILTQNTTITCENSQLELVNLSSVYIRNLIFVGCSVKSELINYFLVEDAMFFGQNKSNSALELTGITTVVVNKCAFISNVVGNLKPVMLKISNNYAVSCYYVGGAVLISQSDAVFTQCLFKQNSAEVGGALFCEEHSNITVIDTMFERNNVMKWNDGMVCYGGAIYGQHGCYLKLENNTFHNNEACSGGAIAAVGTDKLDISECIFSDNEASNGGAIYIWKGTVSINKTVFDYNYADGQGGAIYLEGSGLGINKVIKPLTKNNQIDLALLHNITVNSFPLIMEFQYTTLTHQIKDLDTLMVITFSQFTGNDAYLKGGAIYAIKCAISITWSEFEDNTIYEEWGGAVSGFFTVITVSESEFSDNEANEGGAVYTLSSVFIINGSNFKINKGSRGGALSCWGNSTVIISKSVFHGNIGDDGGAIFVSTGVLIIYWGEFTHNKARADAGGIFTYMTSVHIKWCRFTVNEATIKGGALYLQNIKYLDPVIIHIQDSMFSNNKADRGGAIFARESALNINNSNFSGNSAGIGVIYVSESNISLSGNVTMISNAGSLFLFSSRLVVAKQDTIMAINNYLSPNFTTTTTLQEGGAITCFQSEIYIYGIFSIINNTATRGGGILAAESKILSGRLLLANNVALTSGGGAYLYQSEFSCKNGGTVTILGNKAAEEGGGIHAISSVLKVDYPGSLMSFTANTAYTGGGICLEMTAKLYILKLLYRWNGECTCNVFFTANSAKYGGAIYVSDKTNSGVCNSLYGVYSTLTECFIQTVELYTESSHPKDSNFCFEENHAGTSGSILFGGLLDRCTASPFWEGDSSHNEAAVLDGVTYFNTITKLNNSESLTVPISSHPVRVRFCKGNQPDYESQTFHIKVEKGRLFKVPLVAVDQVNHSVNATIHISLHSNLGGLGEGQSLQETTESCTDVSLEVFSPSEHEELILYARGPCKDAQLSIGQIFIQFLPCTCPVGFQPYETTKCTCQCDSKLSKFIIECHEENETLARVGTFWIAYLSNNHSDHDLREYQYLTHPQCPLDYCIPPTSKVYINLNEEDGSDKQCAFNRSGILCGKCRPGFSLSLGSSRCIKCSVHWPMVCLAIIITATLSGVLLIVVLLALNLTVAMGTINGIIFYANIVNANTSTYFPFSKPNYATIFIAWLNLEFGIDTCFFEGMDMFWNTLLQLIFPLYVIFLVVMVILISEHSTKFARLIGRKNPVATLDTLILLSYSKLLHTIIAVLSFTVMVYPDGTKKVVWLPDANISYLHGKHAFLFFIALIVLLGGIAYTSLLFSWQWLMQYQHKSLFKWVRHSQLQMFIEPYHAPCTFKHRYWTGLLLLVRVVLYLGAALNVTNEPAVNLLVTGIVVFSLLVLKLAFYGPIYRKIPVEILEVTCYVNIVSLSLATFYSLEVKNGQFIVAYTSVTATIGLFSVVVVYHIFTELCFKTCLWKMLTKVRVNSDNETTDRISLLNYQQVEGDQPLPTVSWVDSPQCDQSSEDIKENEVKSEEISPLTDRDIGRP